MSLIFHFVWFVVVVLLLAGILLVQPAFVPHNELPQAPPYIPSDFLFFASLTLSDLILIGGVVLLSSPLSF